MNKKWWLIPCVVVLAVAVVGCGGVPAGGGGQTDVYLSQQNTGIMVSGQGEVSVVPDIAMLRLGVEARADTVSQAQAQASEAMDEVMGVLKGKDIAEKDIQTQQFSVYPMTRWNEYQHEEEITGYRVTNMVVVRITEIDRCGEIIDAVADAGGDFIRIQGISFDIDDPEPCYQEARAKAMADARGKASQLANLAGVGLGKPIYISEGAVYWPNVVREFDKAGGIPMPAPETPISPGELKITLNVQVTYAIS